MAWDIMFCDTYLAQWPAFNHDRASVDKTVLRIKCILGVRRMLPEATEIDSVT